jgi:ribosomal-protein-alanine N-acetyltransferase
MPEIETERVRLRLFTEDDLDDLARLFGNPQVMKFLGPECKPATRDEVQVALDSMIRHWERRGFGRFAAISKENGEFIGCAGLRSFEGIAELVYMVDEPYWGKGLATEIAEACLEYGFKVHEFDRIIAMTRPNNTASRRVMDKLGFKFEKEDTAFDIFVVQYTISREEYQRRSVI